MAKIKNNFLLFMTILIVLGFNSIIFHDSINRMEKDSMDVEIGDLMPSDLPDAENWYRSVGTNCTNSFHSAWSNESCVYTCGTYQNNTSGYAKLILMKYSIDGNQLWNRTWDGGTRAAGLGIYGCDEYVYTCGWVASRDDQSHDVLVIKWHSNGTLIWNATWYYAFHDEAYSIWCNSTDIFCCGESMNDHVLVMKWFPNGTVAWYHIWDQSLAQYLTVSGSSIFVGGERRNALLMKWNTNGSLVWSTDYNFTMINDIRVVSLVANNNTVYLSGHIAGNYFLHGGIFLIKVDYNGTQIWNRTWEPTISGGYNPELLQGGFIWQDGIDLFVGGDMSSTISGRYNLIVMKWNINGTLIWNHTRSNPYDEFICGITGSNSHDSILLCGYTRIGSTRGNAFLLSWRTDGFCPVAEFTTDYPFPPQNMQIKLSFTGLPGDGIVSYQWNFSDGSPNATTRDPIHVFTVLGFYNITLTVTDVDGDVNTLKKTSFIQVVVDVLPTASFQLNKGPQITAEDAIWFTYNGTPGNGIVSYQWSCSDWPQNYTLSSVGRSFNNPGQYTVTLTVVDLDGDIAVSSQVITVNYNYMYLITGLILGSVAVIALIIAFRVQKSRKPRVVSVPVRSGRATTNDVLSKQPTIVPTTMASTQLKPVPVLSPQKGMFYEKIREIMAVSESMTVEQLAAALAKPVSFVWDNVFKWAEHFGFKIKDGMIHFKEGDVDAFVTELDKHFKAWESKEKLGDGKI